MPWSRVASAISGDIGIKVEKKLGKHFYYQADVFNGEGQNKLDTNAQKDLALRLELYPVDAS